MKFDDDALALIDEAMATLQQLREQVARKMDDPEPEPADDFAPENVITASTAAHRFGISKPTIRRWVKDHSIGFKRGGRLIVSVPRLRRHIGDDA